MIGQYDKLVMDNRDAIQETNHDELKAMIERNLLAHVVYTKLKPMFETNVLSDRIDLRDKFGLMITFSKDYSTSFPRLIMEITKFHKSGKTEMIARDCFGIDCGLNVMNDVIVSMIFERCKHIMNKEGELDGNGY